MKSVLWQLDFSADKCKTILQGKTEVLQKSLKLRAPAQFWGSGYHCRYVSEDLCSRELDRNQMKDDLSHQGLQELGNFI